MFRCLSCFVALVTLTAAAVHAQTSYDLEPIRYSAAEVSDSVAKLQRRLDSGDVKL